MSFSYRAAGYFGAAQSGPRVYWAVYPSGQADPVAADIIAGTVANGFHGISAAPVTTSTLVGSVINGLTENTSYKLASVWNDGVNSSNVVVSGAFTTLTAAVDVEGTTSGIALGGTGLTIDGNGSVTGNIDTTASTLAFTGFNVAATGNAFSTIDGTASTLAFTGLSMAGDGSTEGAIEATGTMGLGGFNVAATGSTSLAAEGTATELTFTGISMSGGGAKVSIRGTASAMGFSGFSIVADGSASLAATATGTMSLGGFSVTAVGSTSDAIESGASVLSFGAVTIAGTGQVVSSVEGTGTLILPSLSMSATGGVSSTVEGVGSVAFSGIQLNAAGSTAGNVEGVGGFALGAFDVLAQGSITGITEGVGTIVFDGFGASALGESKLSKATGEGTLGFGGFNVKGFGDTWKRFIYTSPDPIVIPTPTIPNSVKICGIDGSVARLPNDPDFDNTTISAKAGLYGVQVAWTYPLTNPWAVAYWVLYRSTEADFDFAQPISRVSGSNYFDPFDDAEYGDTYYYWVQPYSINGLVGDIAGPASATFQPPIQTIIDFLEQSVSESKLNQDLKDKIARITDLGSALSDEEQERLLGENYFTQILEQFRADLQDVDTLVANEVIQRINGDDALVAQLDLILARSNDNAAAIQTESFVRANELGAIAGQIQTIQATVGEVGDTGALSASIQETQIAVAELEGDLYAQYMLKTDVNGYVAGFGLYNDGATSDFIIRADRFAVGRAGESDVFPFIIDRVNGQDVIALNATALIPDASIGIGQIESIISSSNYSPGQSGWTIHSATGYAEFQNVKARGNIEATSIKANSVNIIDTLMIQGNSVIVPEYDNGALLSTTISSNRSTLCSKNISIGNTGQAARVHVAATATIYPQSNTNSTLELTLWVNGARAGTTGGSLIDQNSLFMGVQGSFAVPSNWTGTVEVRISSNVSRPATVLGNMILTGIKR